MQEGAFSLTTSFIFSLGCCFFYFSLVAGTQAECPIQLSSQRIVVRHGGSAEANCNTSIQHDGIGWEASEGGVSMTKEKSLITWRVSEVTEWDLKPYCYINYEIGKEDQCEVHLPVTVYKTPDSVSISTVNHTGPMKEGQQYELQCEVLSVAPVQYLTVTWYKGQTPLDQTSFTDTIQTPVNKAVTLLIRPDRADDGAQYRCAAELDLGAEGPQPLPKVTSDPLNTEVHYKPQHSSSTERIIKGEEFMLDCTVKANPAPTYTWHSDHLEEKINSSMLLYSALHPGNYTCTATNTEGSDSKVFFVKDISISFVNHTGPLIAGESYELQCDVLYVDPSKSVLVSWYKLNKTVSTENLMTSAVNRTSTHLITPLKTDDGAQYRCEAQLKGEGPPTMSSEHLNITVHYKPIIDESSLPSSVPVFRGYPEVLVCKAEGYPKPTITWIHGTGHTDSENLTITESTPENVSCVASNSAGSTIRHVTLYMQDISISFVNHTGPLIAGESYELQCDVLNVEPSKSVLVSWYKLNKTVSTENLMTSAVNRTSTHLITPLKTDDGAQYRCEAQMKGEGPPTMSSDPLNITVHYKPIIDESSLPSSVPVFRGYPEVLVCKAEGYPKPTITWIHGTGHTDSENLTITESTPENVSCVASNSAGSTIRHVNVVLKEDYLPLIAGLIAVIVAFVSVFFIFIYSIYYKTAKMGHYSLKDAKPSSQNGNIAQNGKQNPLPMKKLSQSSILA